jgi:phage FluMu gp28-like protein
MSAPLSREEWKKIRAASQEAVLATGIPRTDLLLGYQKRGVDLLETTAVLVVEKSRRIGFTWGLAAYAVLRASRMRAARGYDVMYISYSQEMTREFIDACAMWARAFAIAAGETGEFMFDDVDENNQAETRQIKAFRIQFASGFEILALSSAPRSLRGKQGCVIIDEAAFVDSLAELLKAALAFLMWGGQVVVVSTHNGTTNPFNELCQDILKGRKPYAHMRVDFDQALQEGLYQRICLVTGKDWSPEAEAQWRDEIRAFYGDAAEEELDCVPAQGSGVFLSAAMIEERMFDAPVLRLALPPSFFQLPVAKKESEIAAWIADYLDPVIKQTIDANLQSGFGMDVGRYRDLSILAPIQLMRTLKRVVPFLVELDRVPFAQQKQIAVHILKALPRRVGAQVDGTGIGAGIAEDLETGQGTETIKITTEWYRLALPPLKGAFEDDDILIPRDAEVLADLRALKMVRGVPMLPALRVKAETGGTRHGDAAIAIALAYGSTRGQGGQIAYDSAGKKGSEQSDPDDEDAGDGGFYGRRRDPAY